MQPSTHGELNNAREKMAESGEKENPAREQYYRFQAQVIEALTGREVDGTRTNNGSSGGTFRMWKVSTSPNDASEC